MFSLLFVWILVFIIIYLIGFSATRILGKISNQDQNLDIDEIYFLGFAVISVFSSYFSVFVPLNYTSLVVVCITAFTTLIYFRSNLKSKAKVLFVSLNTLRLIDLAFLFFIILFIAINSSYGIQIPDTGLYHAQSVRWIREFAVVPGLGNLHGRFAFNSMFLTISSIFTIDTSNLWSYSSILIYPLNSITLIVLLCKEYFFIKRNIFISNWRNVILGIILSFLCLGFLAKGASSLSSDIICAIVIIYVFQIALEYKWSNISSNRFVLLVSLVFLCITYKLSSILLVLIILPFIFQNKWFRSIGIVALIGLVIVLPFLIRNYYLSGYLIYPFSNIDIFNVDWKIPIGKVISEKSWIESWARIPKRPFEEVLNLSFNQWIGEWFVNKNLFTKSILIGNVLTIIYAINLLIRKEYRLFVIYAIVLANLSFWLIKAPDPRFVYGFLFIGFGFFLSNFILSIMRFKIMNKFIFRPSTFLMIGLISSVSLLYLRREGTIAVIKNPNNWIFPTNFESIETNIHKTNFVYYSPVSGSWCFNTSIPCTPYPSPNLILRKNTIKNGFMIKNISQMEQIKPKN